MNEITIQTLVSSFFFAFAFIFGSRFHRPGNIRRRSIFSFSAGASVAYIFIQLGPELNTAQEVFMEHVGHPESNWTWYIIRMATMLGFIFFFGIDQLIKVSKKKKEKNYSEDTQELVKGFWVHIVTFAIYAWLVSYLMVDTLEKGSVAIGLYALAMGLHFFTVSHGFKKEYGPLYDGKGSWTLAACSLAGWVFGMLFDLPKPLITILLGLVAGGVIVNTLIGELPKEKEGRFIPFMLGAIFYTVLLLYTL